MSTITRSVFTQPGGSRSSSVGSNGSSTGVVVACVSTSTCPPRLNAKRRARPWRFRYATMVGLDALDVREETRR
ncbi:MAG: hypothetical protein R3A48_27390 [Polyangiales bacterium]